MSRYAISLSDLLKDGTPRPKLRLILRARAKAPHSGIVNNLVALYRQYGEGVRISAAQQAALEGIATAPREARW
jgi:hypothetical protein